MRYMTDANVSGLAKELRQKGVDCQTVHKPMRGNEDSRVKITDPEIVKFLVSQDGSIALITLDRELADYCSTFDVPVIRVQDVVSRHISESEPKQQHPETSSNTERL
jgi:hypothetical protein